MPIIIAIILALAGTGTVAVSQNSVPGDALYPVKTLVEKVETVAAFTDAQRANLEVALTQERAQEVNTLLDRAKQGGDATKLVENLKVATDGLTAQVSDAKTEVASLKDSGDTTRADEATKKLDQIIKNSYDGLNVRSSENDGDVRNQINIIVSSLSDQTDTKNGDINIQGGAATQTGPVTKETSYAQLQEASRTLQEFRNFINIRAGVMLASTAKAVETKLNESQNYITTGKIAWEAGDYKKAMEQANESFRVTQEARNLLSGSNSQEAPKPGSLPGGGSSEITPGSGAGGGVKPVPTPVSGSVRD
jgi:hypothetical protein